jgi:hypothetical protein
LGFFLSSSLSFNDMEVLPFLALGPPSSFHSNLVPLAICGPFNISSSLGGRGGVLCNVPCLSCGTLFYLRGMV